MSVPPAGPRQGGLRWLHAEPSLICSSARGTNSNQRHQLGKVTLVEEAQPQHLQNRYPREHPRLLAALPISGLEAVVSQLQLGGLSQDLTQGLAAHYQDTQRQLSYPLYPPYHPRASPAALISAWDIPALGAEQTPYVTLSMDFATISTNTQH